MSVEMGHVVFGHRSISSLMMASQAGLWDDLESVFDGNLWCGSCKVSLGQLSQKSRLPMQITGAPFEHLFMDEIDLPQAVRDIPQCNFSKALFLICAVTHYCDVIGLPNKSAGSLIEAIKLWLSRMRRKGLDTLLTIRADAGTGFMSQEFQQWDRKSVV